MDGVSQHEDIWLAPTGSVCRYIGPDPMKSSSSQWDLSLRDYGNLDFSAGTSPLYPKEWKVAVYRHLQGFGLCLDEPGIEIWIEVEAHRPLEPQWAGSGAENQSSVAYKRFLWPARLCFRRSAQRPLAHVRGAELVDPTTLDPLKFAEKWFKEMDSGESPQVLMTALETQEPEDLQPRLAVVPEKINSPETFASLAHKITFNERSASAVYPTPPGGVTGAGFTPVPSVDKLPAFSAVGLNNLVQDKPGPVSAGLSQTGYRATPTSLPAVDATAPALEIGSGMYDTTVDDNPFDEMDDNLEAKEVTEADFNFFDEPDFTNFPGEGMEMSLQNTNDLFEDPPEALQAETLQPVDNAVGLPPLSAEEQEGGYNTESGEQSLVSPPAKVIIQENLGELNDGSSYEPVIPHRPLSPMNIRDILSTSCLSSLSPNPSSPSGRTTKGKSRTGYEPILFRENLNFSDGKYRLDGKFWFLPEVKSPKPSDRAAMNLSDIPTVGIPQWPNKEQRHLSWESTAGNRSEGDVQSSSISSNQSCDDDSEPGNISPDRCDTGLRLFLGTKDNSQLFKDKDFTPSPMELSTVNTEISNMGMDVTVSAFLRTLLFASTDWSLDGYFTLAAAYYPVLPQKGDLVQVAQLVVDQFTQSSLNHNRYECSRIKNDYQNILLFCSTEKDDWHGKFSSFDLKRYTSIDDENSMQGLRKDFRYATVGSLSKLDSPHIRIHRGKYDLEVLAPAVFFWESFGLEPTQGQKDIVAFCIHPESAVESADAFLDRFGLLYSSANFGQHSRPRGSKGLISWGLDPIGGREYPAVMRDVIASLPPGGETIVIYIVNPFPYEAAIVDICTAFLSLFRKYISNFDKHTTQLNEIALQILPFDFIASLTSIVTPSQLDYLRLAFEVYSRCPPKSRSSDILSCAPPFTLAKSIPKIVPFKLALDPGSPLTERHSLHIAYSKSLDQRWVTTAWTDNLGRDQLTMTYCLREKNSNISRPMSEIRADIWDVTRHIIGKSHAYWRVMVVTDEPVELNETEAWISLAQHHNQTNATKIELTLLSVNVKPCLYLKLPSPPLQISTYTGPTSSTPASTPNPGIPSPDPSAAAPTPPPSSAEQAQTPVPQSFDTPDSETILVDKSDETWSITLSHRLNTSPSLTSYHSALASGYLIRRRGGTSNTDGIASLCVNVVFTHARIPTELLLKDILRMYRDLAALARTKGIIHAQGDDVLPWHISTVVRGREFLSLVL
ncbi:predicted protein [Uncinocarpus reesii 1704]|uniref:Mediator of RNA polymerase II transcription subunit 13 n=1 Tax=Uncinocarpus reesii (strain UAMH 1704) TaxID=336963 RepID=C4JGF9_UNCRE|nr:uncharacterized protein UREG_01150 [Uncinocarpus reesii 1704]EEP76301.1 predicted protein [Uncinocarpus reesii 1704]